MISSGLLVSCRRSSASIKCRNRQMLTLAFFLAPPRDTLGFSRYKEAANVHAQHLWQPSQANKHADRQRAVSIETLNGGGESGVFW